MKALTRSFFAAAAVFLILPDTQALTYTWNAVNGDWRNTSNWNPATGYPSSASDDIAHIQNNGNVSLSSGNIIINQLVVNSTPNFSLSNNASLGANDLLYISYSGNASANLLLSDNASLNTNDYLSIANSGNASANLSLSGNSSLDTNFTISIANSGNASASLLLSGNSSLSANDYLSIANTGNASAILMLSDNSSLNSNELLSIAYSDNTSAILTLSDNSSLNVKAALYIACFDNSSAHLFLSPRASISSGSLESSDRASIHFLITKDSSPTDARIHISELSQIDASLSIDARSYTANTSIPLIHTNSTLAPPIPSQALISTASYANASLGWVSNPNGNTLFLNISCTPPIILSEEERLIYALTDNYTLTEDHRPSTNGDRSHLPKISSNPDGTLTLRFTPLRPGYTYEIQHSTNLTHWSTIEIFSIPSDEEVSVSSPANTAPGQFLRLKITPQE